MTLANAVIASSVPSQRAAKAKQYYPFIDGLRGAAALYVVGFHVVVTNFNIGAVTSIDRWCLGWLSAFGHQAVVLFIVISGYCIGAPFAAGRETTANEFVIRRAKRILPPYYFAILVYLVALLVSSNGIRLAHGLPGLPLGDDFNSKNLIAHLFVVHNWFPKWQMGYMPPAWSIAVEMQIYLVFILILVPVWTRWGFAAANAAAWALGLAPLLVISPEALSLNCSWFLGAFMLGVSAVRFHSGRLKDPAAPNLRWTPWLALAALCACVMHQSTVVVPVRYVWLSDLAWALAFTALIIALSDRSMPGRKRGPLLFALESRLLVWLGAISYTIYLEHAVILMKLRPFVNALHLPKSLELYLMLGIGIPTVLLVSWGLWWLVERPSMLWRGSSSVAPSTPSVVRVHHGEAV